MQRPNLYEITYAHDRRNHRHRCQCCHKIVQAGEQVVIWKPLLNIVHLFFHSHAYANAGLNRRLRLSARMVFL
jgi:hypothetical protein